MPLLLIAVGGALILFALVTGAFLGWEPLTPGGVGGAFVLLGSLAWSYDRTREDGLDVSIDRMEILKDRVEALIDHHNVGLLEQITTLYTYPDGRIEPPPVEESDVVPRPVPHTLHAA